MLAELVIGTTLLDLLLGPILAAIGAGIAALIYSLIKKIQIKLGLQIKAEEEKLIQETIERAVTHTMQTFVDAAKKKSSDGKLSSDDAKVALALAKEEAKKQLCSIIGTCAGAKNVAENNDQLTSRIEAVIPLVRVKVW